MAALVESYIADDLPESIDYTLELELTRFISEADFESRLSNIKDNFQRNGYKYEDTEIRPLLRDLLKVPEKTRVEVLFSSSLGYRANVSEFHIVTLPTATIGWKEITTQYIQGRGQHWEVSPEESHVFQIQGESPIDQLPPFVGRWGIMEWYLQWNSLARHLMYPYDWEVSFVEERVVGISENEEPGVAKLIRVVFETPDIEDLRLSELDIVVKLSDGQTFVRSFTFNGWGKYSGPWRPAEVSLKQWFINDSVDRAALARIKRNVPPSHDYRVTMTAFDPSPHARLESFTHEPSGESLVSVMSSDRQLVEVLVPNAAAENPVVRRSGPVVGARTSIRWPSYVGFAGAAMILGGILFHFMRRR